MSEEKNTNRQAILRARVEYRRAIEQAAACVPHTWLDEILSGPAKIKVPAGCDDIQRLLNTVRARILSLSPRTKKKSGVGASRKKST